MIWSKQYLVYCLNVFVFCVVLLCVLVCLRIKIFRRLFIFDINQILYLNEEQAPLGSLPVCMGILFIPVFTHTLFRFIL